MKKLFQNSDVGVFIYILLCFISPEAASKNLSVALNPGCFETLEDLEVCNKPWLLHVAIQPPDNPQDAEYHHLWGGVSAPTVIAVEAQHGSNISVDWNALVSSEAISVQVTPQPYNMFGVAITDVILYDDAKDEGSIADVDETAQIWLPSSLFEWDFNLTSTASHVNFSIFATAFNGTEFEPESGLYLHVNAYAGGARAEERPRLYCSPSAAAVDLILKNLTVNVTNPHPSHDPPHEDVDPISGFNSPRYAVHVVMFSSEPPTSSFVHASDRSLDDEYAPGIFKLDSITTERARAEERMPEGGYLQWRPVSYLTDKRDVNDATLPSLSPPSSNSSLLPQTTPAPVSDNPFDLLSSEAPPDVAPLTTISDSLKKSLAYAVMGDDLTALLAGHTLVSFGQPKDGFYTTWRYTDWSFTGGSGSPPSEGLSTNVLVVIIVGLGLPVLAMLAATVGLAVWKCSKRDRDGREALLTEET